MKKVLMLSLVSCLFIAPISFAGGKCEKNCKKECCNKGDKASKDSKSDVKEETKEVAK